MLTITIEGKKYLGEFIGTNIELPRRLIRVDYGGSQYRLHNKKWPNPHSTFSRNLVGLSNLGFPHTFGVNPVPRTKKWPILQTHTHIPLSREMMWIAETENIVKNRKIRTACSVDGLWVPWVDSRTNWHYTIQIVDNINRHLLKLDKVVNEILIPTNTFGHFCSEEEWLLLLLTVKSVGLTLLIFLNNATSEYENLHKATRQQVQHIKDQNAMAPINLKQQQVTQAHDYQAKRWKDLRL